MQLAISDFVTVFEITRGSNGVMTDSLVRLLIGVGAFVGGASSLIVKWRKGELKRCFSALFVIAWSCFWIYLHNFPHVFGHVNSLVGAYRNGGYQVVEGPVEVIHRQPATGHTKGDVVSVNGKQFEVNYFYATPAYHNTLAHGGVLGSGVYARLYYYNGEILRVDLAR